MNKRYKLILTTAIVAILVITIGWATDARLVAQNALLGLFVVAFLPAIVCLVLAAVSVLFFGVSAFIEDWLPLGHPPADGDAVASMLGFRFLGWYYTRLSRLRHPIVWGLLTGGLVGGTVLAILISAVALPKEAETAERLATAHQALELYYETHGAFPDDDTRTLSDALLSIGSSTEPYTDGYGRPLEYTLSGVWKLASFRVRSHGHDPANDADDLCVSGSTALRERLSSAVPLIEKLAVAHDRGDVVRKLRLESIRAFACPAVEADSRQR